MRLKSWGILVVTLAVIGCGNRPAPPKTRATSKAKSAAAPAKTHQDQAPSDSADLAENPPPVKSEPTVDIAEPVKTPAPAVERAVRPAISARKFDDEQLARNGIHRYESRHLRLYTDIPAEKAKTLPPLIDAVFDEWVKYFGPQLPDPNNTEFQITGFIMADAEKFRALQLLPADLPPFIQGRHRGAEFWMFEQATDYYRRHLVIHECTHSYMAFLPDVPLEAVWYLEGIAELFGTHDKDTDGKWRFRVFPAQKEGFANWGRTEIIREELKHQRGLDLNSVFHFKPDDFLKNAPYGWSWGLCQLLDRHPRYRAPFRRFVKEARNKHAAEDFHRLFAAELPDLTEEWLLFTAAVDYGFDVERAAIEFRPGKPLANSGARVNVTADRGWQSTGIRVQRDKSYRISAAGRCSLAQKPIPWESEPPGVSIRYAAGQPIGQLLGTVRADSRPSTYPQTTMLRPFVVGRELRWQPDVDGTLYLRINDFWNELADNRGAYQIEVRPADGQ
jgi:hypothetical protein